VNTLKAIVKTIDWISQKVGSLLSWVLLCLVGLSCYEVFTRRFLGKPTIWTMKSWGISLPPPSCDHGLHPAHETTRISTYYTT
jgi:hypothetical protein